MTVKRTVLSQGEVGPGVVHPQYWREDFPRTDRYYTIGRDGERVSVYVVGGYQPPTTFGMQGIEPTAGVPVSHADPRLSNRVER